MSTPSDRPVLARAASGGRGALGDQALVLGALAVLAVQAALEPRDHPRASLVLMAAVVVLALLAARRGLGVPVLAACLVAAAQTRLPWQAVMALALVAYAAIVQRVPVLKPPPGWAARGRLPLRWIALVGGVTPGALSAWLFLARPDLSDLTGSALLKVPLPFLIGGGVAFALVNAALEEIIWRGVIQSALSSDNSSRGGFGWRAAVPLQALSFGLQHAHGFPRGVLGVVLAATWGIMLGQLRSHCAGLLAPFLAHVVAEATIVVLVLGFVL